MDQNGVERHDSDVEVVSTISDSTVSSLTDVILGEDREEELSHLWKNESKNSTDTLNKMLMQGMSPVEMLQAFGKAHGFPFPSSIPEATALRLLVQLMDEQVHRTRQPEFHDFTQAVELFKEAKNILVITGAGVSVSCGIPDFRSSTGIYATLKEKFPDLPRPTSMFDIEYFRHNPNPFFHFAKEIFPGVYKPSISHMFIKFLEDESKLLRNYTQNIDTLERVAGISNVVECHGSFATATCLQCHAKYRSDDLRENVMEQKVAHCSKCSTGIVKPDIIFFGENLPDHFHTQMGLDKPKVDLVVVIGSSLRVQPVALIPHHIDETIPQILINRENLRQYDADIKLLGDCDGIILALTLAMGGNIREKMIEELKSREKYATIGDEIQQILDKEEQTKTPFTLNRLTQEEFLSQVAGTSEEAGETNGKDKDDLNVKEIEDLDEVPSKRQKLDINEGGDKVVRNDNKSKEDEIAKLQAMYEPKYVPVASKLEGFMYAKFQPNLNIFKGADFYMDTEFKTFGSLPTQNDPEDEGSEQDDDDDESSCQKLETRSLPDEFIASEREVSISSTHSCPEEIDFL